MKKVFLLVFLAAIYGCQSTTVVDDQQQQELTVIEKIVTDDETLTVFSDGRIDGYSRTALSLEEKKIIENNVYYLLKLWDINGFEHKGLSFYIDELEKSTTLEKDELDKFSGDEYFEDYKVRLTVLLTLHNNFAFNLINIYIDEYDEEHIAYIVSRMHTELLTQTGFAKEKLPSALSTYMDLASYVAIYRYCGEMREDAMPSIYQQCAESGFVDESSIYSSYRKHYFKVNGNIEYKEQG